MCLLLLATSCDNYPRDTYHTLEEVENEVVLIGFSENPPWVIKTEDGLDGIEVRIVTAFAESIHAEIEWVNKNEQNLLKELEHHNLHLVISGLTDTTPWKGKVGVTHPYIQYHHQKHILAVPPGEHAFLFALEDFLKKHTHEIKTIFNEFTETE